MNDSERTVVKQGWIQTACVVAAMVATILLTFARLDAKADTAIASATRAEDKAKTVELQSNATIIELTRIRTVLEERLPAKKD